MSMTYSITAITAFGERIYWGVHGWSPCRLDRWSWADPILAAAQSCLPYPDAIPNLTSEGRKVGLSTHSHIGLFVPKNMRHAERPKKPSASIGQEQQALGWLLSMVEQLGDISFSINRRHSPRPLFSLMGKLANKPETKQVNFFVDPPSDGSYELIRAFQDLIHELTPPPSGGQKIPTAYADFYFTKRELQVVRTPPDDNKKWLVYVSREKNYWTGSFWSLDINLAKLFISMEHAAMSVRENNCSPEGAVYELVGYPKQALNPPATYADAVRLSKVNFSPDLVRKTAFYVSNGPSPSCYWDGMEWTHHKWRAKLYKDTTDAWGDMTPRAVMAHPKLEYVMVEFMISEKSTQSKPETYGEMTNLIQYNDKAEIK